MRRFCREACKNVENILINRRIEDIDGSPTKVKNSKIRVTAVLQLEALPPNSFRGHARNPRKVSRYAALLEATGSSIETAASAEPALLSAISTVTSVDFSSKLAAGSTVVRSFT